MLGKKKVSIKEKYGKDGYLDEVLNPKGDKAPVYIYQGVKKGFSARYTNSNRSLNVSSNNAESLAKRLAKKGHKKVEFWD